MDWPTVAGLFAGGIFAGAVNAIAGGSSFVTFPLLIASGLSPLIANATNFVALTPANMTALLAYREELGRVGGRLPLPLVVSAVGGVTGSLLLIWSGEARFTRLVPWLVLLSTVLFALGTWTRAQLKRPGGLAGVGWDRLSLFFQLLLAVYGGYFGAGMGIVLLACLALFGYDDLHEANAVKNAFITIFSIIGTVLFAAAGIVAWPHALAVLSGALLGGYLGIHYARRVPQGALRLAILAWAVVLTGYFFWKYG